MKAPIAARPSTAASGRNLAVINAAMGEAARRAGTGEFYPALLAAFRLLVPHDMATVVRYSAVGTPNFLLHHGFSDELMRQYETTFFLFDPFYRHWVTTEQPGVVSLGMFSAAATRQSRYVREFLQESRISDELGVFLPAMGRASIALFLERAEGRFRAAERVCVEGFYPLLAGLEVAHLNAVFGEDMQGLAGRDLARAILVCDSEGAILRASRGWRQLEQAEPGLMQAVDRLAAGDADQTPLGEGRVLHRTRVSAAHAFAPLGWLFAVEKAASISGGYDHSIISKLSPALTRREIDIVKLILEGHPTVAIAQRLGLQRGTVKNHRLRIYEKLDITSERELFITYIRALQQGQAAGKR